MNARAQRRWRSLRSAAWAGTAVVLVGGAIYHALGPMGGLSWCAVHAPHRYLREVCMHALPRDEPRAVGTLIAALDDEDKDVRYAAAIRLREFPQQAGVVSALLAHLDDPEPLVRSGAIWSLSVIGDRAALGPIKALADDPAADVRSAVAAALGYLPDRGNLALLQRLSNDPDPTVREHAAAALARLQALPK